MAEGLPCRIGAKLMLLLKKALARIFSGLLAILPVVATLYLIYWIISLLEQGVGSALAPLLPAGTYRPGFGFIAALTILALVGLALETYIARAILRLFERLIDRVPMVKMVYRAMRDISKFLVQSGKRTDSGKPVWVTLGGNNIRVLGFVTLDHYDLAGANSTENVVVYLPMSYQIGGYTVVVSRDSVSPADMSFEEAMRFAITAGVAASDGLESG